MTSIRIDWQQLAREGEIPGRWQNATEEAILRAIEDLEDTRELTDIEREILDYLDVDIEEEIEDLEHLKDEMIERINEDMFFPMMNYGHIIDAPPEHICDEGLIKVGLRTNCTVMHDTEEDQMYVCLTGGGMDLSQCIAMAYILLSEPIPIDFLSAVCSQRDISQYGGNFDKLKEEMLRAIGYEQKNLQQLMDEWERA